MKRRTLITSGIAAPLAAIPVSVEAKADIINRYAAALYEAFQPASKGNAMTNSPYWSKASGYEREFGLRYAEAVLTKLGLI